MAFLRELLSYDLANCLGLLVRFVLRGATCSNFELRGSFLEPAMLRCSPRFGMVNVGLTLPHEVLVHLDFAVVMMRSELSDFGP